MSAVETTSPKSKPKAAPAPAANVFEMPKFDMPKFEMPTAFREFAEKGISMAKENYDKMKGAAEEATDVIEETKDGSQEKNDATQQKLKIIDYMNKEKVIENLIKNKGFADALVLMTDNSVNVTVAKQEITQSDVAKICDIVMRETGRDAGQIVIQSKY
jgi:hypothetical protein